MPRGDKKILPRFEVPIPSEDIQKTIVKRCRAIDTKANKARKRILESRDKIEAIMMGVSAPKRAIRSVCSVINPSKSEIEDVMTGSTMVSFIEMASLNTDGYIDKRETRLFSQVNGGSYTYFKEGDLLFAKITPCMENGKCCIADGLTNHIGFGSSEYHVFRANEQLITKEYLFACMNLKSVRIAAEAAFTGASGHRRVPIEFYENLEIPVPTDLKEQQRIASEVSSLRTLIKEDKDYLAQASHKKMGIISELLNNVSRV